MERELLGLLVRVARGIGGFGKPSSRATYTDLDVLAVAFWAALCDRPISWATRRENWPPAWRRRPIPSNATISRRLREPRIELAIRRIIEAMRIPGAGPMAYCIDGRALTIARHSADPDAAPGRAAGGMGRGYKLHQIVDSLGNCRAFLVTPLNIQEQKVAKVLITQLRPGEARQLLADNNYDINELHDFAGHRGIQLNAQRPLNAEDLGHRQHSVWRVYSIAEQRRDPKLLFPRGRIEGNFGTQGNTIGGLGPLPNRIRRLHRVRPWVAAKLAIDAAHRLRRAMRNAA